MKKIVLLILSAIMLITLTACTELVSNSNDTQTSETKQPQISSSLETSTTIQEQSEQDPFETAGMPQPFERMGGDANGEFSDRYTEKFYNTSLIEDELVKYLGVSEEKFAAMCLEKWPDGKNYWDGVAVNTMVSQGSSVVWLITDFDIPDDAIIAAIEKNNEYYTGLYNEGYINHYQYDDKLDELAKSQLADNVFTENDIEALLSRDEVKITEQFAATTAIVVENKAFSPAWLYLNQPSDYAKEGITPEMIEEKLDLYAEFEFTNEANEAFSKKITEFTGEKVSLDSWILETTTNFE